MQILIRNLHKHAPRLVQQFLRQQQPVAQVGEVGVDAQLPGVAEGLDHLRLLREVFVLAVLHVALVDEGLEVGAVLDAVGRVDVDHLHLPGHALFLQERVHHQERIARDQPVGPTALVLVEVDGVSERQVFERRGEEVGLVGIVPLTLPSPGGRGFAFQAFAHRRQDARRVDALVHVQADRLHLEAQALGLAGPVEIRRGVALQFFQCRAHGGRIAARQRVVDELLHLRAAEIELQGRVDVRVVAPARGAFVRVVLGPDHADFGIVLAGIGVAVAQHFRLAGFTATRAWPPDRARLRLFRYSNGRRLALQREILASLQRTRGRIGRGATGGFAGSVPCGFVVAGHVASPSPSMRAQEWRRGGVRFFFCPHPPRILPFQGPSRAGGLVAARLTG